MSDRRRVRGTPWVAGTSRAVSSLVRLDTVRGPSVSQAVQAGISLALPILIAGALGRVDLGLLASSGAFTSLYGQRFPRHQRLVILPAVGAAFTLIAALGGLAGTDPLLTAAGLIAVSILGALAAFRFSLGPPGPMFGVLVFGLAAHACRVADGQPAQAPWVVALMIGIGSGLSCVVAAADAVLVSAVRRARRGATVPERRAWHPLRRDLDGDDRELLIRVAIVAVVGTAVSMAAVDPDRAYWTVGAGLAVIGARPGRGRAAARTLHRILGTVVGAALYVAVATFVDLNWFSMALLLGTLQTLVQLTVARHYAVALILITPLVLTLTSAAVGGTAPPELVWERVADTVVGGLLGGATGLVHRPAPGIPMAPIRPRRAPGR